MNDWKTIRPKTKSFEEAQHKKNQISQDDEQAYY